MQKNILRILLKLLGTCFFTLLCSFLTIFEIMLLRRDKMSNFESNKTMLVENCETL